MNKFSIALLLVFSSADISAALFGDPYTKPVSTEALYQMVVKSQKEHGVTAPENFLRKDFDSLVNNFDKNESNSQQMGLNIYAIKNHPAIGRKSLEEIEVKLYEAINDFVDLHPNHIAPKIYRAAYYYGKGQAARSGNFSSNVTFEQIEGMRFYFRKALLDLDSATNLDNQNIYISLLRIGIKKYDPKSFGDFSEDLVFAAAIDPANYYLWGIIFTAAEPKWGGSKSEIELRQKQILSYTNSNPRLVDFASYQYRLEGKKQALEYKYSKAIEIYEIAYQNGNREPYFLSDYAFALLQKKKRELACEITRQSLELNPNYWWANYRRAQCGKLFKWNLGVGDSQK